MYVLLTSGFLFENAAVMKKYRAIALNLVLFLFLFVFLRMFSEYHFYCIEQNQLFLHSWAFIADKLMEPGGLATVISESLVQFFILPSMGALLTSALLTSLGSLSWAILRRLDAGSHLFLLAWLPIWSLLFMHWDINYLVQGTVAFGMMLMALYVFLGIRRFSYRLVAGLAMTALLFFLGGPVAALFAFSVFGCEVVRRMPGWYYFLVLIAEVAIIGMLAVYCSWIGEYRFAFLPDGYYHFRLQPGSVIYFSWFSFFLALVLVGMLKGKTALAGKKLITANVLQVSLLLVIFWKGYELYGDQRSYRLKTLEYFARTEQWDRILDMSKGRTGNQLYACYLNLALAHTGSLADDAFKYDQCGPRGLLVAWNKSSAISALLSDVNFAMGNIAVAQEKAFESNVGALSDGNPRMIKRLVQTNLIYGAYPVAEKYIALLEQTFYYKDWARQQRRFLYNDEAVASDPLLGNMRKCLLADDQLSLTNRFDYEIMRIAEQNPSHKSALYYVGVFYLLAKDMEGFERLIETYYGTEVLPVLPVSFQEAVIISSEKDPGKWKRFGVSESIERRFAEYKQQVLAGRNNSSALPGLMYRSYGDTYWYYFMFK